jgi:dipeptidyl aminopeptidase/acylaminoacyl peptidase
LTEQKQPITAEDLYKIVYVEDPQISPDGRYIAYVQVTVDKMDNGYKRNVWLAFTDGSRDPIQITRSGKDSQPRWSPDGKTLAFTSGRDEKPQIYLLRIAEPGGEPRPLTSMPNGANSPAWSPDGTQIAFLAGMNAADRAKEDSGVEDPKPVDKLDAKHRKERRDHDETKRWDPRIVERIPYRSGTSFLTDHFQQIYVMPVAEGLEKDEAKPRRLTNIDADHNPPEWTQDGQFILTARIGDPSWDEPWRWSNVYRIRVSDGAHEQLTDETYSSFAPLPSPDGQWIAFGRIPREQLSERITRLSIMPAQGGEIRELNMELDRNIGDYHWKPDSSGILFTGLSEGNIELYEVSLEDGNIEKLIAGEMHIESFDVQADAGIAYNVSTPFNPSELFWQASSLDQPVQLTHVNQKFLDSVIVQKTHELRWTSPSGVEIQGWYILPVGYEEGKTYPLAFNIHGGPHVMWGSSMKTMWHEWQFQAARGYAVFYANPRGADGYGEAFQMALHGAWGDVAYEDLMAGIDTLLELRFVDSERMAVTGGSYGGYMTAWIVGHTDRFKAAASQRGVYNLLAFSGVTDIPSFIATEFGVEMWDDPMFLWKHSPVAYANQIKTPLLIIHSENDFRVPIAEGEQLFAAVRRTGGTVKLVRYPRDGHEMTRSGEPEHRVSSMTHIVEWFDKYCMMDADKA